MKNILSILFLFALLASSCSEDEWVRNQSSNSLKFTASFEENESRTYMGEGNLLRWTAGDQISLFVANALNQQYQFEGKTGANSGYFKKIGDSFGTGNDLNHHYAVYPYASDIEITESGVITATLPAEQNYAENSFGLRANTMVAVTQNTDDTFLKFKNVGGYLKLQLYGDNITVKTITLTGANNEKLAGKATITPSYGSDPIISMADEATATITLNCGDGVKIGSTAETATAFWIVVPPTTFEKGFTITVTDIDGGEFTQTTTNKILVERNVIKPMAALEVVILDKELEGEGGDLIPYITFTAEEGQCLTILKSSGLEYSVNGGEWTSLGVSPIPFGGELGKLRLRGKNMYGTSISNSNIEFTYDVPVYCSGDIRTLIDYENYTTATTQYASFEGLFKGCSCLVSAPSLPITKLATNCYRAMFEDCKNLVTAPELPATTLSKSCYNSMFRGCTSLITPPKLPAKALASGCYNTMFRDCTSLVTAPELPATTVLDYCYGSMFQGCTSLVTAPELPAITIGQYSCCWMFSGCTSLVTAPELPATTIGRNCYENMFGDCISLVTAPELPATNLVIECYTNMFKNCTSLKNVSKLPATTLAESCYNSMFSGCTSLVTAPELPATNLASYCYYLMFENCTSLIDAPELPATVLAVRCYSYMFSGCSSLPLAPLLSATFLANFCYDYMFKNCTSLLGMSSGIVELDDEFYGTSLPKSNKKLSVTLPATNLTKYCYSGMFYNCTSLINAPELPATTLTVECCYNRMFYGCKKLDSITMHATQISGTNCLYEWVKGVASTGTFIKSPEMTSLSTGIYGIPNGWTVKNYGEE